MLPDTGDRTESSDTQDTTTRKPSQHSLLLLTLDGYFGLLFLTSHLRNSAWGIAAVFGLTGFMGYTLAHLTLRDYS